MLHHRDLTPTAAGTRTGTVSVTDNAPDSPQTVSLTGTGIAPIVTFSPTSLTFATQLVCSTSPAANRYALQYRNRCSQHLQDHNYRDRPSRLP